MSKKLEQKKRLKAERDARRRAAPKVAPNDAPKSESAISPALREEIRLTAAPEFPDLWERMTSQQKSTAGQWARSVCPMFAEYVYWRHSLGASARTAEPLYLGDGVRHTADERIPS